MIRFKTLATKYIFEAIKVNEPRVQVEEVNFKLEPISGKSSVSNLFDKSRRSRGKQCLILIV